MSSSSIQSDAVFYLSSDNKTSYKKKAKLIHSSRDQRVQNSRSHLFRTAASILAPITSSVKKIEKKEECDDELSFLFSKLDCEINREIKMGKELALSDIKRDLEKHTKRQRDGSFKTISKQSIQREFSQVVRREIRQREESGGSTSNPILMFESLARITNEVSRERFFTDVNSECKAPRTIRSFIPISDLQVEELDGIEELEELDL